MVVSMARRMVSLSTALLRLWIIQPVSTSISVAYAPAALSAMTVQSPIHALTLVTYAIIARQIIIVPKTKSSHALKTRRHQQIVSVWKAVRAKLDTIAQITVNALSVQKIHFVLMKLEQAVHLWTQI
tara:strand:- start:18232 stop:18612 length:381 start_codon:yes stop_codon:yes gene_type:complete